MIVPSMSRLEMYEALSSDLPKLKIRAKSLTPKMAKQFKKGKHFPAWRWDEYTHQESHNKYLISFYAPTASHADTPIIHFLGLLEDDSQKIVVHWGCWMYRKHGSVDAFASRYIGFFTSHFFSRYRERKWKNDEILFNELLCRYISRNHSAIPLALNEEIHRNYKKYGEFADFAFQVPDGTCFIRHWNEGDERTVSEKDGDFISVVLYHTFVNNGMMSETQNRAIVKEGTKYVATFYKNLFKDIMKDAIYQQINQQVK